MAAGNCVLDQIMDKDILHNVGAVSGVIFDQLQALKDKYPVITSVRGMGLLIGIEFDGTVSSGGMKEALFSKGFLVSAIGKSTIRIAPPLIISQSEAKKFCKALAEILKSQKKRPLQITAAGASESKEQIKEEITKETGITISAVDENELE